VPRTGRGLRGLGAARLLADRAVVVALAVAVALAALTAVGSSLVLRGAETSSRENVDVTAELAAAYVDTQLRGLTELVTTWTERPSLPEVLGAAAGGRLAPETTEDGLRLAESLRLAKADIQYAFLTDADGVSLANSPRTDAALGTSFADRDWFRGAVTTGRTYVSEVYRARVSTGRPWVIAVAAPVYAETDTGARGPLLGVVAATYSVSALQAFVDRVARDGEQIELVDHHGLVVARSDDPAAVGAGIAGDPLATAALAGGRGADRGPVGDDDVFGAWRPLAAGGWALTVRQPAGTALADARRSATVLGSLATALVVTGLAATVLYRSARNRRQAVLAQVDDLRRKNAERFGALYRASPVGIIEGSPDGTIFSVNEAMARMLGREPQDMVGTQVVDHVHPTDGRSVGAAMPDLLSGRLDTFSVERVYRHRDGSAVPVLVSVTAVRSPDGTVERLVAALTDISGLRASERALRSSEERFRTAFQASLLGMLLLDGNGRVQQVNPAAEHFFGRSARDLLDVELHGLATDQDQEALQAAVTAALDGERPQLELAFPVPGRLRRWGLLGLVATPGPTGALLVQVEDVTERRAAEQLLSTQALHDPLTHLPNRRLLLDRLEHAMQGLARAPDGPRPALLFLDLDGFKAVNDRFGHEAGDVLLREVADRLRQHVRPTDTVARLGGDEFVVLDETVADVEDVRALAQRLLEALGGGWPPGRQLTASIGFALASPDQSAESLLRDADSAMYRAKQRGKNRYEAYDEQLRASAERRLRVEDELRTAMSDDGLVLAYQPVVDLAGLRVSGVEALLRLRRPGGGLVDAVHFIEVAEDSGLVVPLGHWVLDEACRQAAGRHRDTGTWLPVAVNVCAKQVARVDVEDVVLSRLSEHGVPGSALALEMTESTLLAASSSALAQLARLRGHGVQIGLDGFGTGVSSLSRLAELPLDFLKVDRSFVAGLPHDRTACAIVESAIGLALRLGLRCIAEGIETREQLDLVRGLGPVEGQGFLLGRPLDAAALLHALTGVPRQREGEAPVLVW
jgi:diguanylate cyclase (GGDEF)-like protein/PAS domain S-box-containing protein